ncbi:MAG: hypothetical protein N2170_00695 [Bacteroidia bacterium]|nr:hypothetical protein [Bacteroidia bacterium]
MEKSAELLRLRRSQVVGWLIFLSYLLNLFLSEMFIPSSQVHAKWLYRYLYGLGILYPAGILFALYHPSTRQNPLIRILCVYGSTLPILAEAVLTYPLPGGTFWWVCFTGGYGAILLLEPKARTWQIHLLIGGHILLAIIGVFLHRWLNYIPANEVSNGHLRFGTLSVFVGIAAYLGYFQYKDVLSEILRAKEEQEMLISDQRSLLIEATIQREEAIKRREEAEAAIREVQKLREEERQRSQREAFIVRYEALMRSSYSLSSEAFARLLLEYFAEDLQAVGGVFYLRRADAWHVLRTYAYPFHEGKIGKGGALDIAAHLRKPYLLHPVPAGTPKPSSALCTVTPQALLYLPFYSEATQETMAITELLLGSLPTDDFLLLLEAILPRIGTYIWARERQVANAPS